MNHADHVALIKGGVSPSGGMWADLGAGEGAFTLALAEHLGKSGTIFAIDSSQGALDTLARRMARQFPAITLHTQQGDFRQPLPLPPLDGILMANSLHFVRQPAPVVSQLKQQLKPNGRFLIVEYNTDRGNRWVPHPFTFSSWEKMAKAAGFHATTLLGRVPSRFLGEIYAAVSW